MTPEGVRRIALGFDGATERDHHGRPSFRGRTIFATLWSDEQLNVMLSEDEIRERVAEHPDFCSEQWWGKKLAAVHVHLPAADPAIVTELLEDAWRQHG